MARKRRKSEEVKRGSKRVEEVEEKKLSEEKLPPLPI
jgi:hypothetical protein